jgi:hypothetical protein
MKIKDEIEREREIKEIKETLLQRAAAEKGNYNAMLDQTMPFGDGARLKPLPNHAVGEVYKPSALNTHDPHDMHVWADNKPWWLLPLQVLGAVSLGTALLAGIYYSTLILFLL